MAISGNDPFRILSRTESIIKTMGWTGLGKSAIGTLLLAGLFGGIDLFNAMLSVPIAILGSFAEVLPAINVAFLGGPAELVNAIIGATAASFGSGWTGLLGPFQGPLGIAIALFMIWEVLYFLDVTNSDAIGFVIDLPDILFDSDSSGVADDEIDGE